MGPGEVDGLERTALTESERHQNHICHSAVVTSVENRSHRSRTSFSQFNSDDENGGQVVPEARCTQPPMGRKLLLETMFDQRDPQKNFQQTNRVGRNVIVRAPLGHGLLQIQVDKNIRNSHQILLQVL